MNNNDSSELIPVTDAETCSCIELGLIYSSSDLPDDFTILISDFSIIRSGVLPSELMQQWEHARADLIRRGYRVTEWNDAATMQSKARCQLSLDSD
jgi:hypothetical protein